MASRPEERNIQAHCINNRKELSGLWTPTYLASVSSVGAPVQFAGRAVIAFGRFDPVEFEVQAARSDAGEEPAE